MQKNVTILLFTIVLYVLFSTSVLAERIFAEEFIAACNLPMEEIYNGQSVAPVKDTIYYLLNNGDIYTRNAKTKTYSFYASVPAYPTFNIETPFAAQSLATKEQVANAVICLIPSAEEVYGFNYYTGAIGLVNTEGIQWQERRLDVSVLMRKDIDYPEAFGQAFIEEGKLYAFHDMNRTSPREPQTVLLIFDLSTGEYESVALPDTIAFCRYRQGELLLLVDDGSEVPALCTYAIGSGQRTDVKTTVPISIRRATYAQSWYLHEAIGGLAYDATCNGIYIADTTSLWRSIDGEPFEQLMTGENWDKLSGINEAWVLSGGEYVFRNDWLYALEM